MVRLFLPAVRSAMLAEYRNQASLNLTRTACALQCFYHDNQRYPENLSALHGTYLKTIPTDPFTDKSLTYHNHPAGYLLYSHGPNMQDDKGKGREQAKIDGSNPDDIRISRDVK